MNRMNVLFLIIGIVIGIAIMDAFKDIDRNDPEQYDGEYIVYEDPVLDTYTQSVLVNKSNKLIKEKRYVTLRVVDRTRKTRGV